MTATSLMSVLTGDEERSVMDDAHLERMTLGDRGLEREVLEIFARQIAILLARIAGAEPALAAASAHTLMGSARGIGAWRVAEAAERLEHAAVSQFGEAALDRAIDELNAAAIATSAAIAVRLASPLREVSRDR